MMRSSAAISIRLDPSKNNYSANSCLDYSFYEPPLISRGNSLEFPEKLEKGMSLSLETYVTDELEGVRIEEQFFVTDNGIEILSLVPNDERLLG